MIKRLLDLLKKRHKKREQEHISLGVWCSPAIYLKRSGLRKKAYPFDWIFITPEQVLRLFETNFKDFLNKQNLVECGPKKKMEN